MPVGRARRYAATTLLTNLRLFGGRVVMPGLIDVHWHALLAAIPEIVALTADVPYVHLVAARRRSARSSAASRRSARRRAWYSR
jgi:imidazolonepropionase-like amidohydrolase